MLSPISYIPATVLLLANVSNVFTGLVFPGNGQNVQMVRPVGCKKGVNADDVALEALNK